MGLDDLPQPFTRAEATSAGVSGRRLDLALGRGDLVRIAPGVYALAAGWTAATPWERHRALAIAARRVTPDAILSHTSAGALLGLPMPPRPPPRATMTVLDDVRTSSSDNWRDFHRGATPPSHVVIRRGMPELVPARTVLDAVRVLRPRDGLALLDGALRRGLVRPGDLRAMRIHQRRWPGVTRFDALLSLADSRRESWLESASTWTMASWAVPLPTPQVLVLDASERFVARVDGLWAAHGVVGEADGATKYALGASGTLDARAVARNAAAQLSREDRLRDLGLGVVRWGTTDLDEPLVLRDRVLRALDRGDPARVTARLRCSCCQRPLTDCPEPTRLRPNGVGGGQ
ncbi:type IV toxin-antitoxin system AbiEi family antitoxin domain-containing protein [Oryzobacter terrae]|uniref:type IV toxin-antitoxin system AbiEi family antitoxin domain-containing protein n=1 Tax=Oryzobacter terrae TaxID=1620385 RepID=UPI0036719EFF